MNTDDIIRFLSVIGFTPVEGQLGVWRKSYPSQYQISVTIGGSAAESRIDYGETINLQCGRDTTRSFAQSESSVVLECVDTLLTRGYLPSSIHLEKSFTAGRTQIWLDVLVTEGELPYLMIDCKTWGHEFNSAKADLLSEGGQLMSYYINDRRAKFIAYYASRVIGEGRERQVISVDTASLPPEAATIEEIVAQWDKSWFEHGLIESEPYQVQETRLSKRDLRDITSDDRGRIFNGFAEIMRRHVVSDKPNAFNKLFNLFICKIYDEEKLDDETLEFQWSAGEDSEAVLNRLAELYRRGMQEYLSLETPDLTGASLASVLSNLNEHDRLRIVEFIASVRTFGSNEFSFKEVFDTASYNANALVVREVVRLLQGVRLRYGSRQPFLGEFFENLLNLSVKQEAGQFFTPLPITRFIVQSLPIREIINRKVERQIQNFLPYVVDFASGSGHFVTTAMEAIDEVLQALPPQELRQTQRQNQARWKDGFSWAGEFLYGVEKDYRLAKASKVACFLNGDGDAHIIHADGLDNFSLSRDFVGRLRLPEGQASTRDNAVFDVLVANPPYAVEQCKATVPHGQLSFELFEHLTDTSSAIESLFVERMKQLVAPGGVAGVILPSSMLPNAGIESRARRLIFNHFKIRALVAFRDNTFMATSTNTVVMFLEKRAAPALPGVDGGVARFMQEWRDNAIAGLDRPVGRYAEAVWGIDFDALVRVLRDGEALESHPIYREYESAFAASAEVRRLRATRRHRALGDEERGETEKRLFLGFVKRAEAEKISYFLVTHGQTLLLVKAPSDPQENREFLGYEFSKRRGREGMRILGSAGISTPLYSETDPEDPQKISHLIRKSFNSELTDVPSALGKWATVTDLHGLLDLDRAFFRDELRTVVKKKKLTDAKHPCFRVSELVEEVQARVTSVETRAVQRSGSVAVVSQERDLILGYTEGVAPIAAEDLPVVLYGDHMQTLKFLDFPFVVGGQGVKLLKPKVPELNTKLLFHLLRFHKPEGQQQYQRHFKLLREQYIPLPQDSATRDRVLERCEAYEKLSTEASERIARYLNEAFSSLSAIDATTRLSDLCEPRTQRVDPANLDSEAVNYVALEDVQPGLASLNLDWESSSPGAIESTKLRFAPGDVLFGRLRPYLAKGWVSTMEGICSTEFAVLQPAENIPGDVLVLALLHPSFISQANELTRGQARPRVVEDQLLRMTAFDIRRMGRQARADLSRVTELIKREQLRLRRARDREERFVLAELWAE